MRIESVLEMGLRWKIETHLDAMSISPKHQRYANNREQQMELRRYSSSERHCSHSQYSGHSWLKESRRRGEGIGGLQGEVVQLVCECHE